MANITLFSQIISKLDRSKFNKLVKAKQTDKHCKGYTSWTHLVSMLFCQFAKSQSVRDISNGLRSATGNLNHLGIDRAPSKSSISYQNKHRDHELFKEYYFQLLESLGQHPKFKQVKFRIKSKIFLLDSTTISLCLSLFDWAKYKTAKGAVKMHTILDFDGNLPAYVNITDGKTADNKGAYDIPLLKGSVIVADRFYNDFPLLNVWDSKGVFFVIRHKENLQFETLKENNLPDNRHQHILKDEIICLKNESSKSKYLGKLRRVSVWDEENNQVIELITNQFNWSPNTIGELYKSRWQVEIFFRDIKQLLHIKSFVGTSENAVMIQIWTALITILILKALKAQSQFGWYLSNLVAFIRLNLVIETCFNNSAYNTNASTQWTTTGLGAGTWSRWYRADATGVCTNTLTTSTSTTTRPNMRFEWSSNTSCSGTPNAGTATITSATGCANTVFSLNATDLSTGTGLTFQWQSSPNGSAPWTNVPGGTTASITTSAASTTFYRLQSTCSNSGQENFSNSVSYNVTGGICECGVYSANYPTSAFDTEISSVTVGSMSNNLSTCSVAASGPGSIAGRYSNFTTSVTGPSEIQGSTVSYNVIQNSCSGFQYTNIIQIYVDWDQNGIFDLSEMVAESTAGTNVSPGFSGTFTVPLGALLGTTRMRVVCAETTVTGLNYAQSAAINWGETEDYCFTVLAASPCVGTPAPGNTVASVTTGCSGTNTTLSFSTPVNGSGITYQWQSASSSSGPWTDIIGATNPTFSTTITADTWYQCVVTCTEPGGSSGTSTPIEVTVLPANLCPCYPTMFPTNPCNYIDVVTTTGANVDISTNVSSGYNSNIGPGISLFTNTGLTVTAGTSFNLNVQAQGFCDIAYFSVWIDFNQNGVFESSEFLVNSVSTGNTPTTFNLAVPVDALGGFTLMRIIAWGNTPNTDPCGLLSAFYGEHEDFLMEIVQASDCAGTPDAGSATISASTGCVASPFTLTATGVSFGNGISYQWESALDAAGPWTPVAGATSLTLNTSGPSVTTFYRLVTTCSFGGATNITNTVSYIPTNCCNYTFVLTDSFGDGWNGATMDVLEGATVITTLGPTFLTGTSLSISVPIVDGASYSLFYSNGGSWAAEVGIQIIDPFGATIYTLPAGAGAIGTTLFTWTGSCTPPPANPTSITASNTLLCSNDLGEVTLTANGAVGTVHWFTTGCNTTGWFATGNSITVNPSSTTTYFARNLEGTQWSLGCASVTVEVNTAPTANAGIDELLCAGNSLQLNGTFTAVPETQVLNIDQNVNNTCMANFAQGGLAQSFTATTNTSCGAGLTFVSPAFGDLTISLWTNLPNAGGVQLATATSTISGSSTGDVTWPSVSLTPGTTYFLVFQSSSIFECVAGATTNPYAGGILYANTGYTPFVDFDYTFRTFSCTGGGVNTTEWFGNNIVSGSNTLTPTVAPTSTSTYDFVVTNLNNGCSASSSVTITVNNPVSSVDFVVAPAPFTWIDGNTYFADNNTATFTFVGGAANGCDSTVTLNFTVLSSAGPENDFPCDAFNVVSSGATSLNTFAFLSGMNCNNQTGNNTTANPDANGIPCVGSLGRSLWYTFTTPMCDLNGAVPFEIELSTNNAGTNFDTKVYLFSSPSNSCSNLVQLACNNDQNGTGYPALCSTGGTSSSTIVATNLLPNTQYWVKVDGLNLADVGDFVLSGRAVSPPHAVAVVGAGTQLQLSTTNMGAGLYTYYYRQVGSSGYSVSNSATSLTDVRTLSPNVSYETQIMYRCDASSNFNQSQFYRTEPQTTLLQSSCALVNDMTCTFNGPNSYTLTWTEPAGELFTNNGQLSGYRVKRNPIGSTSVFTFGNPAVVCSNGVCSVTLPGNSPTGFNWTIETRCSATNIQVGNTSSCTPQAPEFSGNNNNLSSLANKSMQHAFSFVNAQAGIEFVDVQMYDAYADFGLNTPMMGDYEIFVNDNNEISWRRMDTPVDANFDFVIVPNPSNAMTTVFLNTIVEEGSFTIVDAMGRTIQTGSINNTDNVNFDAAQLQSGVYLVVVTIGNQKMTRRLVVAD